MLDIRLDPTVFDTLEDGAEALLVEWRVQPGDRVEAGQELGQAELVKSTLPIEAPQRGHIAEIRVAPGASFGRGTVLATLRPG
jgi:biotin carboxyl carrier protein